MEILLNPNVIYLLLAGGLILAVLALAVPGTGILELGALAILVAAGFATVMSDLSLNLWAVALIVVGLGLFFLSLRGGQKSGRQFLLALSIILVILGSAYIFQSEVWWQPAVNPALVAAVSIPWGLFFWFVGRKVIESEGVRPRHDLESLINEIGEAKTPVHKEGSVQVGGELWSAYSDQPIQPGQRVRVISRDGFHLKVEAVLLEANVQK
jgi:membrane-bound serine protease (ClpP class)